MTGLKMIHFYRFSVLLALLFLSVFIYEGMQYRYLPDDRWMSDLLLQKGFAESLKALYFSVNGRWFSHLWELFFFRLLMNAEQLVVLYHLLLLSLFVMSMTVFLMNAVRFAYRQELSFSVCLFYSILITSFFYFVFPEGRVEVWYWISSSGAHLLGLTGMLYLAGLAMGPQRNIADQLLMMLTAVAVGGMSETYCLLSILLVMIGILKMHLPWKTGVLILICLGASLLVNVSAGGLQARLSLVPEFDLLQALKHAVHSMLLPFIAYTYLPLKVAVLVMAWISGKMIGQGGSIQSAPMSWNTFGMRVALLLGLIFLSFFIPCFLLSDITAWRMQSFAYLIVVLFAVDMGNRKLGN